MKRYDFLQFTVRYRERLVIESTDEATLDWISENWQAHRPESNHYRRFMSAGEDEIYAWVLMTHFCHEGWEPIKVDTDGNGRVCHAVLRHVTEVNEQDSDEA